ncbi:MAG: hypothetical protein RBT63_01630, partial [Bdellovibrionales bacterium]|nr:hypothetical protein [Bdellovibrionales bacterium]
MTRHLSSQLLVFALTLLASAPSLATSPAATPAQQDSSSEASSDRSNCLSLKKHTVRPAQLRDLEPFCDREAKLPKCVSSEGRPIIHYDKESNDKRGKRILA